jgi:uncharacterized membrane protein YfcA
MAMITVLEIAGVMLVASAFRAAFGFGEALVAVPLMALLIPVKVAAPVAVLASILIAGIVVARDWRHIHFRSAGFLFVSTLVGIPLGLLLLKTVSEPVAKAGLAIVILLFSVYSLLQPRRFSLANDRFAWLFGLAAGVFGGSYGMNGPPLAIYGSLRGWSPERFRATLQGYFLPASLVGMSGYWVAGLWTSSVNHLFLWSLPSILFGVALGRRLSRKLSGHQFDRLLHFGLILIALVLLGQSAGF